MNSKNNDNLLNEYNDFLHAEVIQIPSDLNSNLLKKMGSLLNPNAFKVFLKILGIHVLVGFLSLSICNQFGINPFNTDYSLADWMMRVGGHNLCMVGCGVLFVGLTLLVAGYLLTIEEVKALKRTKYLQTLVLVVISLGIFIGFGAEMAIGIAALWLFGGLIGGFVATEAVWALKRT